MTGARIVWVQSLETRRTSRELSASSERQGSGLMRRPRSASARRARPVRPPRVAPPRRQAGRDRLQVDLLERVRAEALLEAVGRAAGDDPPGADQGDVLAERLGLLEVVGREEDRGALLVQAADVAPESLRSSTSTPAVGSSRITSRGSMQQRAGEGQAPLHPPESFGVRTRALARRSKASIISSARDSASRRSIPK